MIRPTSRALLPAAILSLAGCAAQQAAEGDATPPAETSTARADQGAGARPVVKPTERSAPTLDPAMESQGATALSRPAPAPTEAIPPSTPSEWNPEWFTGAVTTADGVRIGSAVATHPELLEARRRAVTSAFDLLPGTIDQTVTRQLDNGQYRVWVRVRQPEG